LLRQRVLGGYFNLKGYSVTNSVRPRRPHFHDMSTRNITVNSAGPERLRRQNVRNCREDTEQFSLERVECYLAHLWFRARRTGVLTKRSARPSCECARKPLTEALMELILIIVVVVLLFGGGGYWGRGRGYW
jgi:hypothetical protein